jgi:hypothetical protein
VVSLAKMTLHKKVSSPVHPRNENDEAAEENHVARHGKSSENADYMAYGNWSNSEEESGPESNEKITKGAGRVL